MLGKAVQMGEQGGTEAQSLGGTKCPARGQPKGTLHGASGERDQVVEGRKLGGEESKDSGRRETQLLSSLRMAPA